MNAMKSSRSERIGDGQASTAAVKQVFFVAFEFVCEFDDQDRVLTSEPHEQQ